MAERLNNVYSGVPGLELRAMKRLPNLKPLPFGLLVAGHHVPPHPSPLPQGEGVKRLRYSTTRNAGLGGRLSSILPLPWGEGRGEGEKPQPCPASNHHRINHERTLCSHNHYPPLPLGDVSAASPLR